MDKKSLSLTVKTQSNQPDPFTCSALNPINTSSQTFDVVVIGAGIIGLTIARQFLFGSDLSVAVVDKDVPCSGATGAGKFFFFFINSISISLLSVICFPRKCCKR